MAATVLAGEPPRTGLSGVDASFAARACWPTVMGGPLATGR